MCTDIHGHVDLRSHADLHAPCTSECRSSEIDCRLTSVMTMMTVFCAYFCSPRNGTHGHATQHPPGMAMGSPGSWRRPNDQYVSASCACMLLHSTPLQFSFYFYCSSQDPVFHRLIATLKSSAQLWSLSASIQQKGTHCCRFAEREVETPLSERERCVKLAS